MASLDTRLRILEASNKAIAITMLEMRQAVQEMEARVAALEQRAEAEDHDRVDRRKRAGGPEPAASPAPAQAAPPDAVGCLECQAAQPAPQQPRSGGG